MGVPRHSGASAEAGMTHYAPCAVRARPRPRQEVPALRGRTAMTTTFLGGAFEIVDGTPGEFCPHAPIGTFQPRRPGGWSHTFQAYAAAPDGECIHCGLRFEAFMRAVPLRLCRDALTGLPLRQMTWAYSHTGGGHDLIRMRIIGERVKEERNQKEV